MENILNKFTYHFKKVLINAQNLAFNNNQEEIEPKDMFIALLNSKGSLGADIILKQKVDKEYINKLKSNKIHQTILEDITKFPQPSKETEKIIESSVSLAYKYKHKYIGTEHLLFSMNKSEDNKLKEIFNKAKISNKSLDQHLDIIIKSTSKFNDLTGEEIHKEVDNLLEEHLDTNENALDNFTVDLTDKEIQENIDPVIGREIEINRLIEILSRRTKNNPVLLGDAGVGKTAIIEGLAKRITEKKVPDVLINKKILNLDMSGLLAGTMYRGEFESRLKQLINDISSDEDNILFIDELHTIIGAGSTGGSLDAANILKPALARGSLRCIGATTFEEYKKHIETDRALERRFQTIVIDESNEKETYEILLGLKENYEKFHNVIITEQALKQAISLSKRFLPDKQLPDKAIDLIDEAASRIKVKNTKKSYLKKIKEIKDELEELKVLKHQAIIDEEYNLAKEIRDKELKQEKKLKRLKKKQVEDNKISLGSINESNIKEIISEITKIPLQDIQEENNSNLINLEKNISKNIFGQEKALKNISNSIRKAKTGLHDKNKPLASYIFLGPSGVGKTETAKELANNIFGGIHNMLRIDMSEFSEKFNISKLIGAPAGYIGYNDGNKLTDIVKNKPYTLILFDEIEKAHKDVFNLLLPILEEGELTDASGRTINFRNCVIVMTSNIGLDKFNKQATMGFDTEENKTNFNNTSKKILKSLNEYFPPEFLNRIDDNIVFEPINNQAGKKIIQKEINELFNKLERNKIHLELDTKVINKLLKKRNKQEGARSLKRIVDKYLTNELSNIILKKKPKKIKVNIEKDKINIV